MDEIQIAVDSANCTDASDVLKKVMSLTISESEVGGGVNAVLRLAALCETVDVVDIVFDRDNNFYRSNTSSDLYKLVTKQTMPLILNFDCNFNQLQKLVEACKTVKNQEQNNKLVNIALQFSENQHYLLQDKNFRKATKKEILDICLSLQTMVYPALQAQVQLVHLNLALGSLNLPVLERKMTGATLLVMKVLNPTCVSSLVEWCDKVAILEVFFTKSLHAELIKKSFYLLEFLHKHARLQEPELLAMWHAATKKHEAFRPAIFKALTYLAQKCLNISQVRCLFHKLKAMPHKNHDKSSLTLLNAIAVRISKVKQTQNVYFDFEQNSQFEEKKRVRSLSENKQKKAAQRPQLRPQLLIPRQAENPFDVPAEKQDINTADDELSPKEETPQRMLNSNLFGFNDNQLLEESKSSLEAELIPQKLFTDFEPNAFDNNLAREILDVMWQLSLDESVICQIPQLIGEPAQKGGMVAAYHQICIEQLTMVVCEHYPDTWFYFMAKAVTQLKLNKSAITMQQIIRNLLAGLQMPLLNPKLPQTRTDLIKAIDQQLRVTQVCISSYIDFKRECLDNINALNFGPQEDDNLETQSSLDDSDEIQNVLSPTTPVETRRAEEMKEEMKEGPGTRLRQQSHIGTRSFLDTFITNKVYQYSYHKEIYERMNFLKMLISLCPEHLLKTTQLQLLWEVLVQNAFYEKERDLFFIWCTEMLKLVQQRQNEVLLKSGYTLQEEVFCDDCLELLFFETLLKLEHKTFTLSMLKCFWEFFIHVNASYGQIEIQPLGDFKANTHKLIGLESLWQIVVECCDELVHREASVLFTKLLSRLEMTTEIKLYVLNITVSSIRQSLVDDQPVQVARCVRALASFIKIFELSKRDKVKVDAQDVHLKINNSVSGSQGPIKFECNLSSNTSIQQVLQQCADQLFPKRNVRELMLVYKGKDLREPLKTIKEVCNLNGPVVMILSSKSEIELEYEEVQQIQRGQNSIQVQEAITNLREFLGGCDLPDKLIGLALLKCNFDLGEAIDMLTSEDQIQSLEAQLVEETEEAFSQYHSEEFSLSQTLSNDSDYFDLLFDLFNLGSAEVTEAVWSLLVQIPVNQTLFQSIKSLACVVQVSEHEFQGWENIVDPTSIYKMLYSLQIVNQMVQFQSESSETDTVDRAAWRIKFLELGGLNHLYQLLLTSQIQQPTQPWQVQTKFKRKMKKKLMAQYLQDSKTQKNDQAKCQALLISLIQIFIAAALLGINENRNLHQQIYSTFPFKRNNAKQISNGLDLLIEHSDTSSQKNSSQNTPTFGDSPGTPPVDIKKKPQIDEFSKLIAHMKDYLASQVLFLTVSIPEFVNKLLQITQYALQQDESIEQCELIQKSIDTLLPLVIWQPDSLVIDADDYKVLTKGLQSPSQQVRSCIERFCRVCCQNNASGVSASLLQLLYHQLPVSQEFYQEYFKLLSFVTLSNPQAFGGCNESQLSEGGQFQILAILRLLVQLIMDQKTNDEQLEGYLKLTQSVIELQTQLKHICRDKYNLVNFLYETMFKIPELGMSVLQVKQRLKSRSSRKRCMELLKSLCVGCIENFEQLRIRMQAFSQQISEVLKTQDLQEYLQSQGQARSVTGYVGLKNFGSTCYMNSLIQQLYMIKDFSNYLLNFEGPVHCQVVEELRIIFGNLKESQKLSYSPLGFTKVFEFDRGQPINVRQQQDTHDFFSVLLDNVENCHPKLKALVQSTFGGTVINEIKSLEVDCPYTSQREEPFYCLSLDIKNKKSLKEAFDFFVEPELLEGENKYFCDKYKCLVDASRRNYIKNLKNTVVINLKRFEFDYQLMQHTKINDFLEFPEQIDFSLWTQAGLCEKSEDSDTSVGNGRFSENEAISEVQSTGSRNEHFEDLIGTIELKTEILREDSNLYELTGVLVHSGSANSGHYYSYIKDKDGRWLEFNDTVVKEFNAQELADKCYGSKVKEQWQQFQYESSANAYLLFYSKKDQISTVKQDFYGSLELVKQIWAENDAFIKMNHFLDFDYFQFMWDFIAIGKPMLHKDNSLITLQFASLFVFDMIQKVKETAVFIQWMPLLDSMFKESQKSSTWLCSYLSSHPQIVKDVLLEHSNGEVREQFSILLQSAIKSAQLGAEPLVITLLTQFKFASTTNPKKNYEFYEVIKEYLNFSRADGVGKVLGFSEELITFIETQDQQWILAPLDLLWYIIRGTQSDAPAQLFESDIPLSESLKESLKTLIISILPAHVAQDVLYNLIVHLAFGDEQLSDYFLHEVEASDSQFLLKRLQQVLRGYIEIETDFKLIQ